MSTEEITCPHCGHNWTPRVSDPIYCPRCKRTLKPVSSRKIVQSLKTEKQSSEKLIRCSHPECKNLAMFESPIGEGSTCLQHTIEELRTMRQISEQEILQVASH